MDAMAATEATGAVANPAVTPEAVLSAAGVVEVSDGPPR